MKIKLTTKFVGICIILLLAIITIIEYPISGTIYCIKFWIAMGFVWLSLLTVCAIGSFFKDENKHWEDDKAPIIYLSKKAKLRDKLAFINEKLNTAMEAGDKERTQYLLNEAVKIREELGE